MTFDTIERMKRDMIDQFYFLSRIQRREILHRKKSVDNCNKVLFWGTLRKKMSSKILHRTWYSNRTFCVETGSTVKSSSSFRNHLLWHLDYPDYWLRHLITVSNQYMIHLHWLKIKRFVWFDPWITKPRHLHSLKMQIPLPWFICIRWKLKT